MRSVLIRLEGPIQAWATQSKLGVRDTDREPSKSGVLGLVAAALGMERDDTATLARLCALTLAVRVDRPGSLLHDYHTAGGGRFRGQEKYFVYGVKACIPSARYYLQDASFVAALSGDDALLEKIADALQSPRWPLFLGRRACPPSVPPLIGIAAGDARTAVRGAAVADRTKDEPLRLVVEATPEDGGEPRYDVPLSFAEGARRYAVRYVRTEWLELKEGQPKVATQAAAEGTT